VRLITDAEFSLSGTVTALERVMNSQVKGKLALIP